MVINMEGMLSGVKVVELGTHVAVPRASRMLADWGAEVIKIEPINGEAWRVVGQIYSVPVEDGYNPFFQQENQNKKAISINLKEPEGLELVKKLLSDADVFLTNTRPQALAKLGLDYESIKSIYPKLVYAFFGAYGSKGPFKDKPGFDICAYWASSGALIDWSLEEYQMPVYPLAGFGDATCAAAFSSGILAALFHTQKTGKGAYLESSLYQLGLWYNSVSVMGGQTPRANMIPRSYDHPALPLVNIYKTKDGDFYLINEDRFGKRQDDYFELIGMSRYKGDPRFATDKDIYLNMPALVAILKEGFAQTSSAAVEQFCTERDFIFEKVAHPRDLYTSEQALVNDYLVPYEGKNGKSMLLPNNPIKFGGVEAEYRRYPEIGEHTVEIMQGLGYSDESIANLSERGVVRKV